MWCLSLLDFCYFLDKGYKYEPYFCNGCHDLIQKVINFNDVAIVLLMEVIVEFIFDIWAKMMQSI